MNRKALFSSKCSTWATPASVFLPLHREIVFTIDACAQAATAKCKRFVGPDANGLDVSWVNERAFVNPPYSSAIADWMHKARNEGLAGALSANLVPYRPDTDWWGSYVLSEDGDAGELLDSSYDPTARTLWLRFEQLITGIRSIPGRVKFERPGKTWSAPFPSAVIYQAHPTRRPARRGPLTAGWPQ